MTCLNCKEKRKFGKGDYCIDCMFQQNWEFCKEKGCWKVYSENSKINLCYEHIEQKERK